MNSQIQCALCHTTKQTGFQKPTVYSVNEWQLKQIAHNMKMIEEQDRQHKQLVKSQEFINTTEEDKKCTSFKICKLTADMCNICGKNSDDSKAEIHKNEWQSI
jgi:hypothetical protein